MSISGRIIEIAPVKLESGADAFRLWCVDPTHGDEVAVHVVPFAEGPKVGDMVWWQEGRVYYDKDRRWLTKLGNSFAPGAQP